MNTTQFQTNQSELDRLRSTFANVASSVNLSSQDWRALMETGALASLSISRYRGHKALTAQDLGIDQEEMNQVNSIVSLGTRMLLPKSILGQFNSLESNARQVLRRYTLKVPMGYFLPAPAYNACAIAMNDSKAKFETLVEELLGDLPRYRDSILAEYWTLAGQVSKRIAQAGLISFGDRYSFELQFVDRCMMTFPLESDLRGQFSFDLRLAFVPLPYSASQSETPAYANPTSDLIDLRRAVIAEQSKIQNEEISGFVSSVQSEIYTLVNDGLRNVLDSIQDKGFLQSRSTVQLRGLVDRLSQLNFFDDQRLNIVKAEISAILDREPSKRDLQVNTDILTGLQSEIASQLLKIGSMERGDLDLTGSNQPTIILSKPEPSSRSLVLTTPAPAPMLQPSRSRQSNRLF